jgi:WD40 repeat protein
MILLNKPLLFVLFVLISFFQTLLCASATNFKRDSFNNKSEAVTAEIGKTQSGTVPQYGIYHYRNYPNGNYTSANPDLATSSNKLLNNNSLNSNSGIACLIKNINCERQFKFNANGDPRLFQDTEASVEKQAKLEPALALNGEVPEFIGLFAVNGLFNSFISVFNNGQVGIWDLKSDKFTEIFAAGVPSSAADFIKDKQWLALAQETQVSIFDLEKKIKLVSSPRLGTKISSLSFSPDAKSLVIGGEDGKVYRWVLNLEDSEIDRQISIERYIGHSSAITALSYHPLNKFFFSADSFGVISAWQTYDKDLFGGAYDKQKNQNNFYAEVGNRVTSKSTEDQTVLHLRISADGQNLFSALQDGRVEWYLVRGLKKIVVGKLNSGASYDLQLSLDGKTLASIARDGKLRVWRLQDLAKGEFKKIDKESDIFKYNELKSDSLGYFSLLNEIYLPLARKLVFLGADKLIVAEASGRLLEVKL